MSNLYPHNKKVYDTVLKYFENTNKVAVVQATGTGKGYLASAFISGPFKGKKILILAPNNDILINYKNNFGIKNNDNITLMLYQSLLALYKNPTIGNVKYKSFEDYCSTLDFLIIDEFHRIGAPQWGNSVVEMISNLESRGSKILGLSATPTRYNDKSILLNESIPEDERRKLSKARNMVDQIFEGNVVQGITLEEAVACGVLPSFKYILGNYGYEEDIKAAVEKLENARELYGSRNGSVVKLEKLVENLLCLGSEQENLRKIIQEECRSLGPNQKWIIFCSNQVELESIDSNLSFWFEKPINVMTKETDINEDSLNLYSVASEYGDEHNVFNLNSFYNNSNGLHIIKCISKLNEGVHVKDVTGVIMLRKTLSPIVYLQQIGRALSAGNKKNPIIFDFMNNMELMGKICEGQDEYVNSMLKSSNMLKEYQKQNITTEFLSSCGYKCNKEARIVIKNKSISMNRLFSEIQDILNVGSSVLWKEIELKILEKFFKYGAKAVQDELKNKQLSNRSIDAIKAKGKEMGLVEGVAQNKTNELEWAPDETEFLMNYFKFCKKNNLNNMEIAIRLHLDSMPHRLPEAIVNHYQKVIRGDVKPTEKLEREGTRWTKDELYMLKKNVECNIPIEIICDELQRSPSAVRSQIKRMGYNSNGVKIDYWTPEEETWLFENYEKYPLKELAKNLNRNISSISAKYKRLKSEQYYSKRKEKHEPLKSGQNWTKLEEHILFNSWGDDWDSVCSLLTTKTPKQIKDKIIKECKKDGSPNPYKNDIRFKNVA